MRKLPVFGLVAVSALALGCGAGSTGSGSGAGNSGSNKTDDKAQAAKIGQAARDGKFEFTVKQVKCGVAKVGPDVMQEKAQGQFCLVTVQVKNIGKESQMLDDSNQKAYAADGTEYSADSAAALSANQNAETFLKDINPGNQVTGVLVFDIPKTAKLAKLDLHDSAFSGGVNVSLA